MAASIQIRTALESFRFNEAEMRRLLTVDVGRDLARRAIKVEAAAKQSMGREAPPSTPGHPPAVRTGRLWGSITWRLGTDSEGVYADIGTAVYYAPFLELGTSRMAARPFLRPALESARSSL